MILGIDISYYDPRIEWKDYTWDFVFIKASEGIWPDADFKTHWVESQGYTIRGAYHYFQSGADPIETAESFVTLIQSTGDRGELPPVLDFEAGYVNGGLDKGLRWLRRVEQLDGRKPIIYTSPGFIDSSGMDTYGDYGDYLLWQATYPWDKITSTWSEAQRAARIHSIVSGVTPLTFPPIERPFKKKATFYQFTGKCPPEYVPGYPLGGKKAVDVNGYEGSIEDLTRQFGITFIPRKEDDMPETITFTATLAPGALSNFRNAPGVSGTAVMKTLEGPLTLKGIGVKVSRDNYWWGEVVEIHHPDLGIETVRGWIAFTTSYSSVVWHDTPVESEIESIEIVNPESVTITFKNGESKTYP